MHHAAVQGVAHAVDDEGIENETRIRRHIRNRMPPFFDKWETHRAVPVQNEPVTVVYLQEAPRAWKRTVHRKCGSSSTSCTC
jgi:hypothetical protein